MSILVIGLAPLEFFLLWKLTACNKAIPYSDDQLFDLGLLGAWEISSRTLNGTPDPTVDCCEYLELLGDSILEDLSGLWFYDDGDTVQNQGAFTVDAVEGDIQFYHQNSTFTRNYVAGQLLCDLFRAPRGQHLFRRDLEAPII